MRSYLILLFVTCLAFTGCSSKSTAGSEPNEVESSVEHDTGEDVVYKDDLGRLEELTGRINQACGRNYVAVLGLSTQQAGNQIGIDYSMFGRLSDDGAAVLIASAIAAKSSPALALNKETPTEQEQLSSLLQQDQVTGFCVAKAGFSEKGFSEYLDSYNIFVTDSELKVPTQLRLDAFLRGYNSVSK